jgi:hypothetical protein
VSASLRLFETDDPGWDEALARAGRHDFFHTAAYHEVAARRDDSTALLVAVEHDGAQVALPLLVRPIPGTSLRDVTSVYGYPGPVGPGGPLTAELRAAFQQGLETVLRDRGVVSAFSRLHPMLGHDALFGLGKVRDEGQTIALTLRGHREDGDPVDGTEGYSRGCRRTLRRLAGHGFVGQHDPELRYLPDFTAIYQETMRRSGARTEYWYDEADFDALATTMPGSVQLFVVRLGDDVMAASLATVHGGFVTDYLGGTRSEALSFSPDRLVVDTERRWALKTGQRTLHLGGGRGARADSLFSYKSGFAPPAQTFRTWRWILDRDAYDRLSPPDAADPESAQFFPTYRAVGH